MWGRILLSQIEGPGLVVGWPCALVIVGFRKLFSPCPCVKCVWRYQKQLGALEYPVVPEARSARAVFYAHPSPVILAAVNPP